MIFYVFNNYYVPSYKTNFNTVLSHFVVLLGFHYVMKSQEIMVG